jgi:hypothetical protein
MKHEPITINVVHLRRTVNLPARIGERSLRHGKRLSAGEYTSLMDSRVSALMPIRRPREPGRQETVASFLCQVAAIFCAL